MKTIIKLFVLFQVGLLMGQDIDNFNHLTNTNSIKTFANYDTTIKGSPYIQDDYERGSISNFKDVILSIKYNGYGDYMEVLRNGKVQYFLPSKEYPYEVQLLGSSKLYKAFQFRKKKEVVYGFFRLLTINQKSNLLIREEVSKTEAVKPKTGYSTYTPAKFKRESDAFFINFDGSDLAQEVPRRKKDFIKLFGDAAKDVDSYIKKEKLNIKKERDLLRILSFYNQL
ncbi:hypothetical protein GCM10011416_09790 [Polaribacter pacificus]|uniref:Uncharacterized protein n=1 Tax=Polaribacter pacificus TaxID=1775173 RepID=A0A917HWF1_9FLAO|nr:hypothetical protein [Polaribacter pacificus]GGG94492.1 hypothetical protein GCM10011416_09790 [Polaribacter pacificus]